MIFLVFPVTAEGEPYTAQAAAKETLPLFSFEKWTDSVISAVNSVNVAADLSIMENVTKLSVCTDPEHSVNGRSIKIETFSYENWFSVNNFMSEVFKSGEAYGFDGITFWFDNSAAAAGTLKIALGAKRQDGKTDIMGAAVSISAAKKFKGYFTVPFQDFGISRTAAASVNYIDIRGTGLGIRGGTYYLADLSLYRDSAPLTERLSAAVSAASAADKALYKPSYTKESLAAYQLRFTELTAAAAKELSSPSSQERINDLTIELTECRFSLITAPLNIDDLGSIPPASSGEAEDVDELIAVLKAASEYTKYEYSYTAESYGALQQKMTEGMALLKSPDRSSSAMKTSAAAIESAINGLKPVKLDVSALAAIVSAAGSIQKTSYYSAGWSAFEKALREAKSLLQSIDSGKAARQTDIDTAAGTLSAAIAALKIKPSASVGSKGKVSSAAGKSGFSETAGHIEESAELSLAEDEYESVGAVVPAGAGNIYKVGEKEDNTYKNIMLTVIAVAALLLAGFYIYRSTRQR